MYPKDYVDNLFKGDETAKELFAWVYEECEVKAGDGGLPATVVMQIADVVRLEILKQRLQVDIDMRGLGYEKKNGRQTYWQDNKSVSLQSKAMEQQRKLLVALGLQKQRPDQPEDDLNEDGFDEL